MSELLRGEPIGTRPVKRVIFIAECPLCGERCNTVTDATEELKTFYCKDDNIQFVADFQL